MERLVRHLVLADKNDSECAGSWALVRELGFDEEEQHLHNTAGDLASAFAALEMRAGDLFELEAHAWHPDTAHGWSPFANDGAVNLIAAREGLPLLAPTLAMIGSCWAATPKAQEVLSQLFEPGTWLMGCVGRSTVAQVRRLVVPALKLWRHEGSDPHAVDSLLRADRRCNEWSLWKVGSAG